MRIIQEGKLPELIPIQETCGKCHTVFEYVAADVNHDQREESYVICPLCKSYITAKSFTTRQLPPQNNGDWWQNR